MPLYFHILVQHFYILGSQDTNLSTVSFQSVRRILINTLVANEKRHLEDKSRMKITRP
jgi:hypothetical protein